MLRVILDIIIINAAKNKNVANFCKALLILVLIGLFIALAGVIVAYILIGGNFIDYLTKHEFWLIPNKFGISFNIIK